jgi:hypothetical protein
MVDPDKVGLVLWEVITLLTVVLGGIGIVAWRRKASGRPAFTERDRRLFFGPRKITVSTAKFWINFSTAVLLCLAINMLEFVILGWIGPALLTMVVLITSMGIVDKLLF